MSRQVQAAARSLTIRRYAAKTAVVLGAVALIVTMTVPSMGRASADHAPLEALFGTVVDVTEPGKVTVATNSGVVSIIVPGNDVFTGDITAVEDISEGDRVVATVHVDADGTTTADKVLVIPDLTKTVTHHILGVIVDQQDGVVVVQDRGGNTITIDVPEGVTVPETGTVVTAIAQLDRATGRLLAQAFDLVEDAVARLQEAKDRATDEQLRKELEERLERARDQHLSALERAREALERAQAAVQAAIAEREEAQRRLDEVKARFEDLRRRYVQEASDRNERLPELRVEGTLSFDESEWLEPTGVFKLSPRINDADDSVSRAFAWDEKTLAIVPVEIHETDPSSPAITSTTARSVALPLNDVKSLVPPGSQVIVQYDPNAEPALATLITVLPPELSDAIEDALARERLRSISGFITLVEETPDLEAVTGVVVIANREHDVKVAAKVTADTEIEIDGENARIGQLAAGMAVEVDFAIALTGDNAAAVTSLTGRLNALRIRARTTVDDDEVHVAGVIVGLDAESRTVGILPRDGEVVRARVMNDAVIIKDSAQGSFAALEVGDLVLDATRYNRGTLVLTRLVVHSPRAFTFSGAITGLDRNPDRLTVTTADGRALVAFVLDSTILRTEDNARLSFSDLSVGERVVKGEVLPVQRDGRAVLVARELVIGKPHISTARGVVGRVDAEDGELRLLVLAASFTSDVASIEGTVTLDLTVAPNSRSVLTKNGERIRDLQTVLPGDVVEAVSYVTDTKVIVKMSVVSPNLQRVRGVVSTVTDSGIAIETSNGRTVGLGVSDKTQITLNGRRIHSLEVVKNGDVVAEAIYIARPNDLTQGVALRLILLRTQDSSAGTPSAADPDGSDTRPSVETTISGVIEDISGDEWEIGGREFTVTSETRFFGEKPQEGLVAKATLVLRADGKFVATAISVAGRPDTNPSTRPVEVKPAEPGDTPDDSNVAGLVRILGKVQEVTESQEGNVIVVVDGVKITILDSTVMAGKPEVGAGALAVVRRSASGTMTAVTIIFTKPNSGHSNNSDDDDDASESTTTQPRPVATPKPAEDHDDPQVPRPDTDTDAAEPKTVNIVVDQVNGRLVLADDRIYLLKLSQVFGLRIGDTITLHVRKVDREDFGSALSAVDRVIVTGNPLYQENSNSDSNPLYVAE